MLRAAARLRHRAEFSATVRGRRSGVPALVVHHRVTAAPDVRVGFVVSRGVGGAVVRNRVRRRLRHLMRGRLADLPVGSRLVVRANPLTASLTSAQLGDALDTALRRLSTRGGPVSSSQPAAATAEQP